MVADSNGPTGSNPRIGGNTPSEIVVNVPQSTLYLLATRIMRFHSAFKDRLVRHRLTSLPAWRDRALVWGAAAAGGLAVVGFTRLTNLAANLFGTISDCSAWLPLLVCPLGGMFVVALTQRFAPGSVGSGIPQVMSALTPGLSGKLTSSFVSLRIAVAKIVLGASALAAGFSTGREGPSVQIAASVMHAFRTRLGGKTYITSYELLLAGGSAGLAAAFNAPLAGVIFAIEELSRRFEQRTSGLIVSAIVLSGVVSVSLEGNFTYFGHLRIDSLEWRIVGPACLCALLAGLLGGTFSRLLIASSTNIRSSIFQRIRASRPILFAGFCGLLIALLGLASNGAAYGSGYQYTREMLEGVRHMPILYVLMKFLATWLSFWSGVPGGIFAPCLSVGAGLGNDIALLMHINAAPLVALGMVGFLAAATQAPITSFIIVMEMIDGHAMVLSLMATALVASLISRLISPPLYSSLSRLQLEAAGIPAEQLPPTHG
jgi:H+/Cl- antiporter ClcA